MRRNVDKLMREARFVPLADIFIGAIACILILILISKKAKIEVNETPQADYIYACVEERFSEDDTGPDRRLVFRQVYPIPTQKKNFDETEFEKSLKGLRSANSLSSRVIVRMQYDASKCHEAVAFTVSKKLNKAFDTENSKDKPAAYLLLEILRTGNAEGGKK